MKNKSRSRGCAEGRLRRGVIPVGRVGSAGEGINRWHPEEPAGGKGEQLQKAAGGQVLLGWLYPGDGRVGQSTGGIWRR